MQDNINSTYRSIVEYFRNNSTVYYVDTYNNLDGHNFTYFCDNYDKYVHEKLRYPLNHMYCGKKMTINKINKFIKEIYDFDKDCDIKLDGTFGINYEVYDFPIKVQYYGEITVKYMYISNITSPDAYAHSLTLSKYMESYSIPVCITYLFK